MQTTLRKKVGAGLLIFIITVGCIPAMAAAFGSGEERPGMGFGPHGHQRPALGIWRSPQAIKKLKLTDAQVKQLRDLDFATREKILPLKAQIEIARLKMDKAISGDSTDRNTVLAQAKKIADLKGKIFVQHTDTRLTVKEILTADQLEEMKLLFEHKQRRGPRAGKKTGNNFS